MSKCENCKNRIDCKFGQQQAFQVLEKMGESTCSGYEYEKPKTEEELKKDFFGEVFMSECVCKTCLHSGLCIDEKMYDKDSILGCNDYKDKSLCVEFPCKVGETVYRIVKLYNGETIIVGGMVYEFCITHEAPQNDKYRFYFWANIDDEITSRRHSLWCDFTDFGETVFLTKEEAEAKLKEIEGK